MAPKNNPLGLNALQLKTLTLLQELAGLPDTAKKDEATGNVLLGWLPSPHGDHFHIGEAVAMASDATGLHNRSVWIALIRKGLAAAEPEGGLALTPAGLSYDTGLRDKILIRADH
ncbi:MAG: hypothetical protein EXQ85_07610 [Alphaproteobacteria bacterium]|nr:hypothetical protein [Alphaproteobacteria bacterium]